MGRLTGKMTASTTSPRRCRRNWLRRTLSAICRRVAKSRPDETPGARWPHPGTGALQFVLQNAGRDNEYTAPNDRRKWRKRVASMARRADADELRFWMRSLGRP